MKTYNVNDSDKTSLFQNDVNMAASNAMEVVSSFTGEVHFAIVSGLEYDGSKYSAGKVIMDGVLRSVNAGATATDYLAPLNEQTNSRATQSGGTRPVYTTYTTSISQTDTGFPQLTEANVAKYRGWINNAGLIGENVITSRQIAPGSVGLTELTSDMSAHFSFDYIVDSNEALAGLANNPNATNVLIKKGAWEIISDKATGSTVIELHENTKRIVGEAGSKIAFSISTNNSLNILGYATSVTDKTGYSIEGVTIEVTNQRSGIINTGFAGMVNMFNCTFIDKYSGVGFKECKNIIGCHAICNVMGYSNCTNLVDCMAIISHYSGDSNGYYSCQRLTNCQANTDNAFGFYVCDYLVNCSAVDSNMESQYPAYLYCNDLHGCYANTAHTAAYLKCHLMFGNRGNSFTQCSMDGWNQSVGDIAVGPTAEGGYNFTL